MKEVLGEKCGEDVRSQKKANYREIQAQSINWNELSGLELCFSETLAYSEVVYWLFFSMN